MKKRLSLLMVLMMVLSLVPMSAFATAGTIPGGQFSVEDKATAQTETVTVKLTQAAGAKLTSGAQAKFELNKGEFAADPVITVSEVGFEATAEVLTNLKSMAYLTMTKGSASILTKDVDIYVTFDITLEDEGAGDVTLSVEEVDGSNIKVAKPIVIGVVTEETAGDMKVSVKDSEKKIGMEKGQELSTFTISDIDENEDVNKLVLELDDTIDWTPSTVVAIGSKSFNASTIDDSKAEINDNELVITLDRTQNEHKLNVVVKPFVNADGRSVKKGEVVVDIIAMKDAKELETIDAVIGQIVDYDVTMTAVENGKKDIPSLYGGDETTIKVTLSGVTGSFTPGRTVDFTVDGADVKVGSIDNLKGLANVDSDTKAGEDYYDDGEFSIDVDGSPSKLEFTMVVKTDVVKDGAVTITAQSRDFSDLECDVAEVTPAYTVEVAKVTDIKKGESLATADVVIKEAKAGMFEDGQFLVLSLNDNYSGGLSFGSDYKIETTNELDVDDDLVNDSLGSNDKVTTKGDKNTLVLEIDENSRKEAGKITISNILVNVSGSEVDGVKALETYLVDAANIDKAIEVTTDAEEDANYAIDYVNVVKEYGAVATTTVFVIGSKTYTVNGVEMTANEAPYVAGKGYTMLPVRALAESLGLKADWNSNTKTATFSNDSKVASVTLGADTMYVNGTPIPLNAKAEIKNGSTFVELRSLAAAFSVNLEWDAATKTVKVIG